MTTLSRLVDKPTITSVFAEKIVTNGDSNETSSWPAGLEKWQLAILLTAPVVLGAGLYWYFSSNSKPKGPPKSKPSNGSTGKSKAKTTPKTVAHSSDPATNAKLQGNQYFKVGDYAKAIESYTAAMSLCAANKTEDLATFYQNRAAAYEMLKKYREVIEDCTKAIEYNRTYLKALVRRAKAYESVGNLLDALNDITAACILEQFDNQANLIMTDRLLRQHSKARAKEFVKTRVPQMPSKHFMRHYFASYVRDPIVKEKLVDEKYLNDLAKQIEQDQNDPDRAAKLSLLKGTIEILKGNIPEGETELEQVVALPVQDKAIKINALIKLGTIRVHDVDGNNEGVKNALEAFDQAIALDPNNPDIYVHRAQIYILSENVEGAKQDLERCCELSDSFPTAMAQKLYVQFRYGLRNGLEYSMEQALKGFDEATKQFPESSDICSLYAQKNEFGLADEYFVKAIKCDPDDANLYVHRAILQLQSLGDTQKAFEMLEEALKVDSKCQFAYEMLGSLEVQRGNLIKGLGHFEKALNCAQTELDCAHLFSLRDAAEAQLKAADSLGIKLPSTQ